MTDRKVNLPCPRCGQPTGYWHPQFEAYYCHSMNCCFRWTWEPKKEGLRMERDWTPFKSDEKPRLVLYPSTMEDFDCIERFLRALDRRDSDYACIACQGTGMSSKGEPCWPCKGTGQNADEVLEAEIVYEMKSVCSCGSCHFTLWDKAGDRNIYACYADDCEKKYVSVGGVFHECDRFGKPYAASLSLQDGEKGRGPGKKLSNPVEKAPSVAQEASEPVKPPKPRVVVRTPQKASQSPSTSIPLKPVPASPKTKVRIVIGGKKHGP